MKKSFVRVMTLVLALVMLLSLVACGGKQSTATTEADASAENGGSTEATATAYKDIPRCWVWWTWQYTRPQARR